MPIINEDTLRCEIVQKLQTFVQSGLFAQQGDLILPETFSIADKVILLELTRKIALKNAVDCSALQGYSDFAELVYQRRQDPSREQWLWLFQNIGARHQILSVDEVCGIMAGRDALLPFLSFAPDIRLQKHYEKFFVDATEDDDPSPLPYPNLEEAINNDAPGKVKIYSLMCRNVTDKQILNRAVFLQKPHVVSSLLRNMPESQQVPMLIKIIRDWEHPEELLRICMESFGEKIAKWRDEYGNVFFWYLYGRNFPVTQELINALSAEVIETFETQNAYGISPCGIWLWYRQGITFASENKNE